MLLGRRTFEEMSGWFQTQTPIVLTRDPNYVVKNGHSAQTVEQAIQLAQTAGATELVVSGGASIYKLALPHADELVLTIVQAEIDGAAYFPDYEAQGAWKVIDQEAFPADRDNAYPIEIKRLQLIT